MPYVISPIIRQNFEGLWNEGSPYQKKDIYSLGESSAPVNYSSYTLKPHSLCHIETPAHTQRNSPTIESYFEANSLNHFYGKTVVLKLEGNQFYETKEDPNIKVWEITTEQIRNALYKLTSSYIIPKRLIITLKDTPLNKMNLHDPNYVLILTQDAANFLVDSGIQLYGTSWKSSDYQPGKKDRPIHNTLFKKALIMECLELSHVPAGAYFLCAFPLPLEGASESPVCPVLFTYDEILDA